MSEDAPLGVARGEPVTTGPLLPDGPLAALATGTILALAALDMVVGTL